MRGGMAVSGNPDLLEQWDFEKNKELDPNCLTIGSNKKVWWRCRENHSWQAAISGREKHGCPYCSGRLPIKGVNDIVTVCPEKIADWDDAGNEGLCPSDYLRCSEKKVWWRCRNGHSYLQAVKDHVAGRGCPYCCGKAVLAGFNDLCTADAPFLSEWDYGKNQLFPTQLRLHSNKKVWWKCRSGHSWEASVNNRSKGTGCPYCAGRKALRGYNDLKTVWPLIAGQWDYEKNGALRPDAVTVGSNKKVWWRCSEGHSWQAVVYSRKTKGCPYCGRRRLLEGFNDLMTVSPPLAEQWDFGRNAGLMPYQVTACSKQKVWWRCEKGHSWQARPANRMYGSGCPYCCGKLAVPGETDLESQRPDLMERWDFAKNKAWKPSDVTCSSERKAWWACREGHSWKASVKDVARGTGCPYCCGKKVLAGFNDLKTKQPGLAGEWDFAKNGMLMPENVTQACGRKVWWRCRNGHSWQKEIYNRTYGSGCPYCSGHLAVKGETDLKTVNADLAGEWDYGRNEMGPEDVTAFSNIKVWWVCGKGHRWEAAVCDRSYGRGCPYCKGKRPIMGENDLLSCFPELAGEWDYDKNGEIRPESFLPQSSSRVWWKCRNGHSWKAVIESRTARGTGCPYCAGKVKMRTRFIM